MKKYLFSALLLYNVILLPSSKNNNVELTILSQNYSAKTTPREQKFQNFTTSKQKPEQTKALPSKKNIQDEPQHCKILCCATLCLGISVMIVSLLQYYRLLGGYPSNDVDTNSTDPTNASTFNQTNADNSPLYTTQSASPHYSADVAVTYFAVKPDQPSKPKSIKELLRNSTTKKLLSNDPKQNNRKSKTPKRFARE